MRSKKWIVFVIALLLLSISLSGSALAQDDEQPLAGVQLTVLIHPTLYAATGGDTGIMAEFEEATGATVQVVTAPIGEHVERALVEFIAGSGRYDVIAMQNVEMTDRFFQFLLPLDDYIAEADAGDYDWEDVIPSLSAIANDGTHQYGIPFRWGSQMVYYRTDLLEEAGLEVPETLEEMVEVARALTGDGVSGLIQRGTPLEIAHDWLGFFYGAGGEVLDEEMTACLLNSEEGIYVSQVMRDLYHEGVMPEDFFAIGRDDYITSMQQGRSAMGVFFSPYWGRITDPEDSTVADLIGWGLPPTAPEVPPGRTRSGGWFLVVSKDSSNPEAAFELITTITNRENSMRTAIEFANGPVRASVYQSDEFIERFPPGEDLLISVANSATDPPHASIGEILDVITEEVTAIITDRKSAEQGMADACARIEDIIN
jgi:multiple sugar transport system substrate-binding protein